MKIEILDRPNFAQSESLDLVRDTEDVLAPTRKCGIKVGRDELADALDNLGKKLPISARNCLDEARCRVLRSLLARAGEVTGYSVAHVSVLLSVTERTVRNWIVEAELGLLYFGPASSARTLYRGVVSGVATDITGSYIIGPQKTGWCNKRSEAVRKSKLIWHSYRILEGNIEIEIKKIGDD